jgi:hypothetical protein
VLAGLGACCTKKLCPDERAPEITVVHKNFNRGTLAPVNVYALDKDSGTPVDSAAVSFTYFNGYNGIIHLNEGLFGALEPGDLRDYHYVLVVGADRDTIRDVSYQEYTYEVACNKCVLADGSEIVRGYKDFGYRHEGRRYGQKDTLVIAR